MANLLIGALIVVNVVSWIAFYSVVKNIDLIKTIISQNFVEIRKKQIDIGERIDGVADVYSRLIEPLDNMDKNVADMANMAEDTHMKMLYAYNEIEKIKVHGKHVKKDTGAELETKKCVISVPCVTKEERAIQE